MVVWSIGVTCPRLTEGTRVPAMDAPVVKAVDGIIFGIRFGILVELDE